jgi:hypothetical protein
MKSPMADYTDCGRPIKSFFHRNPKLLGLGRQFGQIIWGHLVHFWPIYQHPNGTVNPLSVFSINQPLSLQKTKPLYSNPKYLFDIGI